MPRRNVVIFDPPIAHCPLCGIRAVCMLPPELRAQQTDGTTLVCHPGYGGCNTGFVRFERDEYPESTTFAIHVRLPDGEDTRK